MLGKLAVFVPLLVITIVEVKGEASCDRLGVLLYEEIDCTPVKSKPDDPCPSSYNCSHLQEPGEHCYFQGQKYRHQEALSNNATEGTCTAGCFCHIDAGKSQFTCAAFDCAEFLGGDPLKNPECLRTYELDSCCSVGQVCPPFDNVASCDVDGIKLKEGQRFSPKNACSDCICKKDFKSKNEASFCKRKNCAVQLRHSDHIKRNCAPVYENNDARCCPHLWVCPEESDIFSPAKKNDGSAKTCNFGEKEVKSGQILQKSVQEYGRKYDLKCECQLPPLLTCIITNSQLI